MTQRQAKYLGTSIGFILTPVLVFALVSLANYVQGKPILAKVELPPTDTLTITYYTGDPSHAALDSRKPETVRRALFIVADTVWPEWCESKSGRKTYLGWATECTKGNGANFARKSFLDAALLKIIKHMEVDGVEVVIETKDGVSPEEALRRQEGVQ